MNKFGLKSKDVDAINKVFGQYKTIVEVLIYGSRAMNTFRNGSDIDLTIIENGLTFNDLTKIEFELDDLLLPYKIDLSLKKNITNSSLISHIQRVGKTFYNNSIIN